MAGETLIDGAATQTTDTGTQTAAAGANPAPTVQQPSLENKSSTGIDATNTTAADPTLKPSEPTATATKEAADKAAADAAKDAADKAALAALPEKYELKLPDGFELDPEVDTNFQALAKELKLKPEQAQKIGDLGVQMRQRDAVKLAKVQTEWAELSKADAEFGGEKLKENLGVAVKALDTFATPEFKTFLKASMLVDHPEMLRFCVRVGKAISDDKLVLGRSPTSDPNKSLEKRLYPNNP